MSEYNSPITPKFWYPLIVIFCFKLTALILIFIALVEHSTIKFIFALVFLILTYMTNNNLRLKKLFYQLIVTANVCSLDDLASLTGTDYRNTLIIIKDLINSKAIRSASLDKDNVVLSYIPTSAYNSRYITQRVTNLPKYLPTTKIRIYSIATYLTRILYMLLGFATFMFVVVNRLESAFFSLCLSVLLYLFWKNNHGISRFKDYYSLILYGGFYNLDELSQIMSLKYTDVVKDIKKILSYGYLSGYYIDEDARKIAPPEAETIQACCPQCGAPAIVLPYAEHTCEYCGTTTVF